MVWSSRSVCVVVEHEIYAQKSLGNIKLFKNANRRDLLLRWAWIMKGMRAQGAAPPTTPLRGAKTHEKTDGESHASTFVTFSMAPFVYALRPPFKLIMSRLSDKLALMRGAIWASAFIVMGLSRDVHPLHLLSHLPFALLVAAAVERIYRERATRGSQPLTPLFAGGGKIGCQFVRVECRYISVATRRHWKVKKYFNTSSLVLII